jgi:Flp pilus assembly pilin Flp
VNGHTGRERCGEAFLSGLRRTYRRTYPLGVIFRNVRKKVLGDSLSHAICTTGTYPDVRGGRSDNTIVRRAAGERGQAMAEYAVILALVTIVAVAAYQLLGGPIARLYDGVIASFT